MALIFTILATPSARTMVTTAGSPSGIAATAREIARSSICNRFLCCITPIKNSPAHNATATMLKIFPKSPRRFCRGVISCFVSSIIPAIFPSSVSIPVATTIPSPLPFLISVDIYAVFFLSATVSPFFNTSQDFITGKDSPVRADSLAASSCTSRRRMSAGT